MRWLILVFLCWSQLQAQQIYVGESNALEEWPFFNFDFISKHNIKSITSEYAYKDNDCPISSTRITRRFKFNSRGQLTLFSETYDLGFRVDSNAVRYYYNPKGALIAKDVNDILGKHRYAYFYDKKGERISSQYSIEKDGELISRKEHAEIEYFTESFYKKLWFNETNRIFQEETIKRDSLHRMLSHVLKRAIGGVRVATTYNYSDTLLTSVERYASNSKATIKRIYQYGAVGQVEKLVTNRNERELSSMEFIYKNELLSAHLERDALSGRIRIWQYEYTFY